MAPLQASELKSCMVRLEWESVILAAVFRIDEGVNRSALGGSGPNPGGKGQRGHGRDRCVQRRMQRPRRQTLLSP